MKRTFVCRGHFQNLPGCRLRHDRMNFEHDQIPSGHVHQPLSVLCHRLSSFSTSLRPSSTATRANLGASTGCKIGWRRIEPAWRYLENSLNERLWQQRSSTLDAVTASASLIRCNLLHCVVRRHPTPKHSMRVSNDSRSQVEARLSPLCSRFVCVLFFLSLLIIVQVTMCVGNCGSQLDSGCPSALRIPIWCSARLGHPQFVPRGRQAARNETRKHGAVHHKSFCTMFHRVCGALKIQRHDSTVQIFRDEK